MEFGVEKCVMLIIRSGKQQMIEGRELLNKKNKYNWRKGNL